MMLLRKNSVKGVKALEYAKYFQRTISSFTESSSVRNIYRYPPAKQKIYSKLNLSSGVHLDCYCDK